MATCEENLKIINDELEKMSDEELEQVAGGGKILVQDPLELEPEDFQYKQSLDTIQKNKS